MISKFLFVILFIWTKLKDNFLQLAFQRNCIIGKNSKIYHTAKIINIQGNKLLIVIGKNTHIKGEILIYGHGGKVVIGDNCFIGEGTKIWSSCQIEIEDRVLIAHGVNIHDNISHPINAELRHKHFVDISTIGHPKKDLDLKEKKILIKRDSWIGFNSTILKGVTVGEGAIIGACSLVTKDVKPNTIVVGNPAKEIVNR